MRTRLIVLEQRVTELEEMARAIATMAKEFKEGLDSSQQPELSIKGHTWYLAARGLLEKLYPEKVEWLENLYGGSAGMHQLLNEVRWEGISHQEYNDFRRSFAEVHSRFAPGMSGGLIIDEDGALCGIDSNFRFGIRKAQMLLACVDLLREFWHASDQEKLAFRPQVIESHRHRIRVRIQIETHSDFEYSTGQTIDRPWLRLRALPPDTEHIGLGTIKCRAVCEVKNDLEQWLRRHGVV